MNPRPKIVEKRKSDALRVCMSDQEQSEIRKLAEYYRYSTVSEFARRVLLGYQVVDRKAAGLD
jgi:hypothetical protein